MEIDFAEMADDLFTTVTFPQNQTIQFMHVTGLSLKDGIQKVKINAKNALGISSENVFYNISLHTSPPNVNSKYTVHWEINTNALISPYPRFIPPPPREIKLIVNDISENI